MLTFDLGRASEMLRMKEIRVYSLLLVIGLLGGGQAMAAERVALVIGNSKYAHAPYLSNPERDVEALARTLSTLGFDVTGPLLNQSKVQMEAVLKQFGRRTRTATAAVVYFSGHGMEVGGKNYLIPTDAVLEREDDASIDAVSLDVVLDQISGARGYRLVILDACRDNPLANNMVRTNGAKAAYRGLAPVEPAGQTYVAYAARAGQRSQDGAAGGNSPYAAALLKYLPQPGLPLERLFGAVRDEVKRQTNGEQTPFLYGEPGTDSIYLAGMGPVTPPPPLPPPPDYDLIAWQSAEKCGTAACFQAYLEDYPKGRYARMAQARLKPASAPTVATPAPEERSRPAMTEPTLVRITGGRFEMGSPESETGRDSDEKQHPVTVKNFEIGQHEVTVGEFKRFVAASGYKTDAEKNGEGCYVWSDSAWQLKAGLSWRNPNFQQGDDHPVVCVSWNDAVAYTQWLPKETGQSYRLPTEAEWEYAARAGTKTARYWGDDPDQACRYANVADQTAKQTFSDWTIHNCPDGYTYTAPVGSFKANAWGLKDMLGNVWEWTCSAYDKDYGGAEKECTNNTGGHLAVRGGSWDDVPAGVRSADRIRANPAFRSYFRGFRLAR